ncbi:MAG: chemotaxis protein CheW [Desulfuromonadales bacterium]|nr:chemotaxis protein CheW [Desulfuromonadales bacterium]
MGEELLATQYLTFVLDDEVFAVDVARVREILEYTCVTRVPKTQTYMRGVINLRGSVVPVVDLRLLFGLPEADTTVDTCIIVMEIVSDGSAFVMGALTDSVREVLELDPGQIEAVPKVGSRINTDFINGMGNHNNEFIIILNVDKMMQDEATHSIEKTAGTGASSSHAELTQ